MNRLKILLYVIGVVQLVLGALYLAIPLTFLDLMNHSLPADDIAYPLGMLAARFIAYGVGMFVIAQDPLRHRFWIDNMVLIQVIDLGAGLVYTATGAVALSLSAFPMFNAGLFIVLLVLWRPRSTPAATSSATEPLAPSAA